MKEGDIIMKRLISSLMALILGAASFSALPFPAQAAPAVSRHR